MLVFLLFLLLSLLLSFSSSFSSFSSLFPRVVCVVFDGCSGVHPSIFWSILRGNGAHIPDPDLESFKTRLSHILSDQATVAEEQNENDGDGDDQPDAHPRLRLRRDCGRGCKRQIGWQRDPCWRLAAVTRAA